MKIYFFLIIAALFSFTACTKDTSEYLMQSKKDVTVDDFNPDGSQPEIIEGELKPGIQLVKLDVAYEGVVTERRFKYFMPVSIDRSKPISLIFDFHGSWGGGTDPIQNISMTSPLAQIAIKENCIIVSPAGQDVGAAVNWQNSEYHLPFVDAMVAYFKNHTPTVDKNRIYTTGHSSGAIFSFVLAYYRSDVFAAAVPVSGQMKISGVDLPNIAIPIRAFNGTTDESVSYSGALGNIRIWANQIAGYFPSDAELSDTLIIDNYKSYTATTWHGGKADIEFYSILDEGHGISWYNIMPLMWEFMKAHPKNATSSSSLYFSSELKDFHAKEGQSFTSEIRHTGTSVSIVSAPSDWNVTLSNGVLKLKAPGDFFGASTMNRKGTIKLKVEGNGTSKEMTLPYSLEAPKAFFEVGDIIYDGDYKPLGVVCWVNPLNIKDAKIVALATVTSKFGPVGTSFFTPSKTDGYGNTLALIAQNNTLAIKLTAANSAFVYAYEYKASPGTTTGWYLPAVDELKALDANLTDVNAVLKEVGTPLELVVASASSVMSSTVIDEAGKKFYTFNFNNSLNPHAYNVLAAKSDDTAYISTRPFKKVTKP